MALGGLVLGSLILYLKGMRIMMFQLSGFYCKVYSLIMGHWDLWGDLLVEGHFGVWGWNGLTEQILPRSV